MTIWGTLLRINILKIGFVHARGGQKIDLGTNLMNLGPQMAKIRVEKQILTKCNEIHENEKLKDRASF